MRFRLLGPVEVVVNGRRLPVDRPRQRGVLAYLLLHANRLVTTDELVEALWRGAAPATARTQIQTDLSIIRRVLREAGHDPITSRPFEYVVRVDPGQLDVEEFTRAGGIALPAEPADLS